jgi:hypothetical protein
MNAEKRIDQDTLDFLTEAELGAYESPELIHHGNAAELTLGDDGADFEHFGGLTSWLD